ncbi:MAG TPA: hypothetical protein VIK81_01860 [Patescibacteria group bacterium]
MIEQDKEEVKIPRSIYDAEVDLWPHKPGVIFDPRAKPLISTLYQILEPLVKECENIKQLTEKLGVVKVFYADLTPPRGGYTWFRKEGTVFEISSNQPYDRQITVIAHECCHAIFGPLESADVYSFVRQRAITGNYVEIPNNTRKNFEALERVCNWGAGYITSRLPVYSNWGVKLSKWIKGE